VVLAGIEQNGQPVSVGNGAAPQPQTTVAPSMAPAAATPFRVKSEPAGEEEESVEPPEGELDEDDLEGSMSLAAIEAELKPKVLETFDKVADSYKRLRRLAHPARGARAPHALRHRHEHRPHARGGRPAVLGDPRAHPPDRGEGAAQAQAPVAVATEIHFRHSGTRVSSREPGTALRSDPDCGSHIIVI
jgi:hypothetical protein